ncbi:M14 family zinc carboxypeptidase [Agromyces sp. SYSU T0242]|uniref:M14 family zinc carboxypeptidase n=1 Tax=Agromyces litoreus TaxID=3158561 RepID=UPI00339A6A40
MTAPDRTGHLAVGAACVLTAVLAAAAWSAPTTGTAGWDPRERDPAQPAVAPTPPVAMPTSYPWQPVLETVADDPTDASIERGAMPYDEIAPLLNRLTARSDRVSVQVVGRSGAGRDIHLVTVTAPERVADTRHQADLRDLIAHDPATAAASDALLAEYKLPIWVNANIHGNEWEGTDAVLEYVEHLATAPDAEVGDLLEHARLYFTVSSNPDGRVLGERAGADGLDVNRDLITGATAEARLLRDLARAIRPTVFLDLHGYTGVLQVEPCGPPHGENSEVDLLLPHAYAAALEIEEAVVASDIPGNTYLDRTLNRVTTENTGNIRIPYRDLRVGWDDWPPVFAAQYVALQGAMTNTVELPLGRVGPPGDPRNAANAAVDIEVAGVVVEAAVDYAAAHADALVSNQVEFLRRGSAGEPLVSVAADLDPSELPEPNEWAEIWDETDAYAAEFPRAYVIPAGAAQRSATDAARLADQLIAHGVEVQRSTAAFTAAGTTYEAGSYVVDLHQPLRGLANALLADGSDLSDRVRAMYDISAWSLGLLWGADVDAIGATGDPALVADLTRVIEAAPTGAVPSGSPYLELATAGVAEYRAVNELLDAGVAVSAFADGSVIVRADAAGRAAASEVADRLGVAFTASDGSRLAAEASSGLADLVVAYSGGGEDLVALRDLGFGEPIAISAASLARGGASLAEVDVLWVGGALDFSSSQSAGRSAVEDYLAGGGGVVGEGTAIASFANGFGLVDSTATAGRGGSNGIVAVDAVEGGLFAARPLGTAFASPAVWYTDLGANAVIEQAYADDDPLVSGHWRDSTGRSTTDAAGRASAVSAETAAGNRVLMFGTSMTFRAHPRGQFGQVARALLWAGPAGTEVPAP